MGKLDWSPPIHFLILSTGLLVSMQEEYFSKVGERYHLDLISDLLHLEIGQVINTGDGLTIIGEVLLALMEVPYLGKELVGIVLGNQVVMIVNLRIDFD